MFDNVVLYFANDKDGKFITINEVNKEDKSQKYYCPLCGSELIPKMGSIQSWHFAHIDKSKCTNESAIHWWFKNKLLEQGDNINIVIDGNVKSYICKSLSIEKKHIKNGIEYKPDITLITDTNEEIYIEINKSNKKNIRDYIKIWEEFRNTVVEIDIKEMIRLNFNSKQEFKAIYYDGMEYEDEELKKVYKNSIQKYKDTLIENRQYETNKEEVEKLEWLWNDVKRYINGEIDIEYMFNIVQSIEKMNTREIVVSILKNRKCTNLLNDLITYKTQYLKDIIVDILEHNKGIKNVDIKLKNHNKILDKIYMLDTYIRFTSVNSGISDTIYISEKYKYNKQYLDEMMEKRIYKHEFMSEIINLLNCKIPFYDEYKNIIFDKCMSYNLWNSNRIYLNYFNKYEDGHYIECDYESKDIEKIKTEIISNMGIYFNNDDLDLISKTFDKIMGDVDLDIKLKFYIVNNNYFMAKIYYEDKSDTIIQFKKGELELDDLYDKIIKIIGRNKKDIIKYMDLRCKYKSLNNIIKQINEKLSKEVTSGYFELYDIYDLENNKPYNYLKMYYEINEDKIGNVRINKITNKYFSNFLEGRITLEEVLETINIFVSDKIRSLIYSNFTQEVR